MAEETVEQRKKREREDRERLILLLMLLYLYGYQLGAEQVGVPIYGDPEPMARAWAEGRADDLLAGIWKTTNKRASEILAQSATFEEYLERLAQANLLTEQRAETISRTEGVRARNIGQIAAFLSAGISRVRISDGREYDIPCMTADQEIWPLTRYLLNPLEHMNCVRSATPILDRAA